MKGKERKQAVLTSCGMRGERVEAIWPITARGALY